MIRLRKLNRHEDNTKLEGLKTIMIDRREYKQLKELSKNQLIGIIIQQSTQSKNQMKEYINNNNELENIIDSLEADTNWYKKAFNQFFNSYKKEAIKHNKASHHINNLIKFIRTLKEDIRELKIINSDLKSQVRHLKEELEQSKQSKSHLINEIIEQNTIIEKKEEEIKTLIKINVKESNKIEELEEDKIELKQYIQQLEKEIDTDNDIIKELINKRYGLNIELQEKEEEIKELRNKIIDLEAHNCITLSEEEEEEIILEYDEDMELYM